MKVLVLLLSFSSYMFGAATAGHEVKLLAEDDIVLDVLNLDKIEPLTQRSFQEIVESNRQKGLETLIARVKVQIARVKVQNKSALYDAYAFNKKVFGSALPQTEHNELRDPITQRSIKDIRYFIMRSSGDLKAPTVGSLAGMKRDQERKSFVEQLFVANDSETDLADRLSAYADIAERYENGKGVGSRKSAIESLAWYNKIAHQDVDPCLQVNANYWISILFRGKGDLESDSLKRLEYLQKVANQTVDKRLQAKAHYHIGLLYGGDGAVLRDFKQAREHLEKAINQNVSIGSKEYGLYHLALIDESEGNILSAQGRLRTLLRDATIPEVRQKTAKKWMELVEKIQKAEEPNERYTLRSAPTVAYQLLEGQCYYALPRDQGEKLWPNFISGLNGSKSPEHPDDELKDQNTPPRNDF